MSKRNDSILFNEILTSVVKIINYTDKLNYDYFSINELVIDAVIRNFQIIGEASRQLSEEFKKDNSNIEWRRIIGLRNIIIHEYFDIDIENIWEIIENDLPVLYKQLKQIKV